MTDVKISAFILANSYGHPNNRQMVRDSFRRASLLFTSCIGAVFIIMLDYGLLDMLLRISKEYASYPKYQKLSIYWCSYGLCLVSAKGSTVPHENDTERSSNSTRIVGGQLVENRTHFAFQVSLRFDGHPSCGASILNIANLLTAAHCVTNDRGNVLRASRFRAFIGDLNTDRLSATTITRWIRYIFVHENYNAVTLQSDIAVLRVDPMTFGPNINNIPLAINVPPANTICTVSGWGLMHYGGIPSNALRFVNVPIISHAQCVIAYGNAILTGMICAGYYGRDACMGDSGGPMICDGNQVGVVSWGVGCGFENYPGVYASVPHYRSWILEQQARAVATSMIGHSYLYLLGLFIYTKILTYCT